MSVSHPPPSRRRPAMISELANRAQQTTWDEYGSFKYFLRLAEKNRKQAKEYVSRGDLEEAFVCYARSASIVLEKLPGHKDYNTSLTPLQRHNLSLNGQEILDNLGHLKPILLERFEVWSAQHPDRGDTPSPSQQELAAEERMRMQIEAEETRGALQQHQEADLARRAQQQQAPPPVIRQVPSMPMLTAPAPPALSVSASAYHAQSRAAAYQPSLVSQPNMYRPPSILPLENPRFSREDDSGTDSDREPRFTRSTFPHPPLTTMSPPPPDQIEYPKLMNGHQKSQGYRPSQNSMFYPPNPNYHPLPQPPSQPPYGSAPPPIPSDSKPRSFSPAPPNSSGLKTVLLPRACLTRFLTIAKVNTARDRETCGLLLGKESLHGSDSKFVVTTLIIPKQHSTSDTCTMDEEELILQVTEERGLITLGWIHTHPSQSCFMSSVDLHTHSGFQRMLPESFAVVCAPSSVPNFGIFRLTDPPGLSLILACDAKEAFHPHGDAPIYTDAERGHVQMKDLTLEIVDLR